jgi:SAM-dependent methyltransferase
MASQDGDATRAAYERLADVWDETDDNLWNEGLERATVRALLPTPLQAARVLDAGCATGHHTAWLTERGCHVVGFDFSPAMVAQARATCPAGAAFAVADLRALPFSPRTFDGILCSLALHYVESMASSLRQFAEVLRPGGWLLLSLDHPAGTALSGDGRDDYFTPRLITDSWSKKGVAVTQSFWRWPLSQTVDALADAGFVLERIGEPQLTEDMRRRFPEESAGIDGRPVFIVYRARLAPGG